MRTMSLTCPKCGKTTIEEGSLMMLGIAKSFDVTFDYTCECVYRAPVDDFLSRNSLKKNGYKEEN